MCDIWCQVLACIKLNVTVMICMYHTMAIYMLAPFTDYTSVECCRETSLNETAWCPGNTQNYGFNHWYSTGTLQGSSAIVKLKKCVMMIEVGVLNAILDGSQM